MTTFFPVLVLALLPATPLPVQDAWPPQRAEARGLLEAGEPDAALEACVLALEYAPDDVELLTLASRSAEAANELDLALWYASMALNGITGEEREDAAAELRAVLVELDPLDSEGVALFESYAEDLFEVGQSLARSKFYLNAVDLYSRCEGTRMEEKAQEQLLRLYDNKKAVEGLLASGRDVPIEKPLKKSAKWIAQNDPKHVAWEDRYEIESKNYTIYSNMGYEFTQRVSDAMEQMNVFLRRAFKYKERGGSMARCHIFIYKSHEEFLEINEQYRDRPGVLGFFRPGANQIETFDPRTRAGRGGALEGIWGTLFHEASHQFKNAVSPNLMPAWANEGMACYFEGAETLPNGSVKANAIPPSRLRGLKTMLDAGNIELEEVITYFEPGSYKGAYYPWGWGLAYFFINYENEDSERVYLEHFHKYLEAYTSGGKHDVKERFVEHFVKKPKIEGVKTFEEFEAHWSKWIHELHELYFGPASNADKLLARAARQASAKEYENAIESYRWALEKRPDAAGYFGLASMQEALKQKDAAILNYRRALEIARGSTDPKAELHGFDGATAEEVVGRCLERISKLNRILSERILKADAEFSKAALDVAERYAAEDFPHTALHLLGGSLSLLRGDGALSSLMEKIQEENGIDLRRWRRIRAGEELGDWYAPKSIWDLTDEGLEVETEGPRMAYYNGELPDEYTFEVVMRVKEWRDKTFTGLIYKSGGADGMHLFVADGDGQFGALDWGGDEDPVKTIATFDRLKRDELEEVKLAVEIRPDRATFFLNGKKVGEEEYPLGALSGRVGLLVQQAEVEFADIRVRH